ncbi:hypothetical protein GCM10020220_006700 [Nonomuraea rubra]
MLTPGQLGDLLTPQAGHPPVGAPLPQPGRLRTHPGPAAAQKLTQLHISVHNSMLPPPEAPDPARNVGRFVPGAI